ncbi:hypothetical protein C461_07149 [Halorubrum aidingense JCM 13560]|uniref:Uncharacterized protein n=1 Tax=Halorubrum aidingense JCM 13560 TaxID=1230454 RepID=M0PD86_9EURY|nr:hypothetical protein [Halorubrum aidingense]EMA67484.1 hypothetical protein C461_07149 [Halorubrum aidingense JCM 13560]
MSSAPSRGESALWIGRFTEATGIGWVATKSGVPSLAPHLFVAIVWGIETSGSVVSGTASASPVWIASQSLELAGLLLIASTVTGLATKYGSVAEAITDHEPVADVDPAVLEGVDRFLRWLDGAVLAATWRSVDEWQRRPAPPRLRRALLACGLLLHATYLFGLGNVEFVLSSLGPVEGGLSFFVIIPFVYYPLLAEFVAVVANVHLALPARIRSDRLLDFGDVSGYGGLRPVGALIEASGHRYVIGLALYTLITITTGIQVNASVDNAALVAIDTLYLVAGTLVGAVLFFYPVLSLHRFMAHQKEARLGKIATRVSELEGNGRTFPDVEPETPDSATRYMNQFMNMNVVKQMHEYPVRLQQVTSIVTGLLLPYLLDYVATYVLNSA